MVGRKRKLKFFEPEGSQQLIAMEYLQEDYPLYEICSSQEEK